MVVVVAPCRNQMAGMARDREQVSVQALVAQAAIEARQESRSASAFLARCNAIRPGDPPAI
jgi:hypothetical protein